MNERETPQFGRLRADLELKSELVRALRCEVDQLRTRAAAEAALMAEVSAEVRRLADEASLSLQHMGPATSQHALADAQRVCSDLADYSAACAGSLVLSHRSVNIRQLLTRVLTPRGVVARVNAAVPERITADERLLERLLSCFVDRVRALDGACLEVIPRAGSGIEAVLPADALEFQLRGAAPAAALEESSGSVAGRMRSAFIDAVGRFMGGTMTQDSLVLPLVAAEDPAATGVHRLRLDIPELLGSGLRLPSSGDAGAAHSDGSGEIAEEPIDLIYLDQQLGSLAQIVLERTAPMFLAEAPRRLMDMHVAYESGQSERLRVIAQVWKSSALTIGARSLAVLLESMERQLGSGHLPPEHLLWRVRLALDRVARSLASRGLTAGMDA